VGEFKKRIGEVEEVVARMREEKKAMENEI